MSKVDRCDNWAKKREPVLVNEEDRIVNNALRKLLIEKLEPAAQCKGHDEDALDMFMEVVRELRQQLNCYPEEDASGYFGVQPVTRTDHEEVMPLKLGTKLYHPVHGTPCCWEIKIEELKLTNKGWIINPDERYIWGRGIPVDKMEELGVYLDTNGSIRKAHYNKFYANQSKYTD